MTIAQETWRWALGALFAVVMTLGGVAFAGHDTRLDKLESTQTPTAVAVAELKVEVVGLREDNRRLEQAIARLEQAISRLAEK